MKRIVLTDPIMGATEITYSKFKRNKKFDHKTWTCTKVKNRDFNYRVGDQVRVPPRPWGDQMVYETRIGTIVDIKYEQKTFNGHTLSIVFCYVTSKGVTVMCSMTDILPY